MRRVLVGVLCGCAGWALGCSSGSDLGAEAETEAGAGAEAEAEADAPSPAATTGATSGGAGQPSATDVAGQLCDELGRVLDEGGDAERFLSVAVVSIAARLNDPHAREVPALSASPLDAAYFFIGSCPENSLVIDGYINARAETEDPSWRSPVPP